MNTMQWRLPLPERRIAVNIDPTDATKNYDMDATIGADARVLGTLADTLAPREPWAGDLQALGAEIRGAHRAGRSRPATR